MTRLLTVWLLVCVHSFGYSQMDTVHIREVKVLAPRKLDEAGLKITRPDSMAMAATQTASLSELLTQYTPVFIKSYGRGSSATASFRGTAASHTQLVWNGININSPMRGSSDLSLIPLFFIDDAYLLHGGSSLTQGSGALGGSIHIENRPDWSSGQLSLTGEKGSFRSEKYFGKLSLGGSRLVSVTRLYYDASANNFPFYNVGVLPYRNDTLKNGAYRKSALMQELYFRDEQGFSSSLRAWGQQSSRDLPQLMSYEGTNRIEFQDDDQLRVQFEAKKTSDDLRLSYSAGYQYTGLRYYRQTPDLKYVNDDAMSKENSFFNAVRARKSFSDRLLVNFAFDANFHRVNIHNKVRNTGYQQQRFEFGTLVHAQLKPSERLAFFSLLRSELYDGRVVPLVPALGAEWQVWPKKALLLKGSLSRNFHKPGLNDLYWVPGGNPGLLPEDGTAADLALSHQLSGNPDLFKQELSVFAAYINNWILWQPASSGAWYWEAANVKKVFSRGIEYQFSSRVRINHWQLHLNGNYAFTRTSNQHAVRSVDESRKKQLIYIPKHTANLHGTVTWKGFSAGVRTGFTGRRHTQSSNEWTHFESVLNPFWVTALTLQKNLVEKWGDGNLRFTAENLFNATYQQILWRPMPGRHYSLTLSINLKL